MFGVFESPERTDQSEAEKSSAFRPDVVQSRDQHRQNSCGEVRPAPEQGQSLVKVNLPALGAIRTIILSSFNQCGGAVTMKVKMQKSGE